MGRWALRERGVVIAVFWGGSLGVAVWLVVFIGPPGRPFATRSPSYFRTGVD